MEKILLAAYLSVLAAFITATASIVKLVNEKESKTTDYRQSWTDSLRNALSQLIGCISLQATYLIGRIEAQNQIISLQKVKPSQEQESDKETAQKFMIDSLLDLNKSIKENRGELEKLFALTSLHFKPNDETFSRFENKYNQIDELFRKIVDAKSPEKEADRRELREKIKSAVAELTSISRFILKTEWEHVKAGEPSYKKTKAWSTYIGIGAFAILIICGIYLVAYAQVRYGGL